MRERERETSAHRARETLLGLTPPLPPHVLSLPSPLLLPAPPCSVKQLGSQYPERLKKIVMMRTPFVFWALWKMVSIFVDKRSADKIVFLKGTDVAAELGIDKSQVPSWLPGGTSSYEYLPEHVLGADGKGSGSSCVSISGSMLPSHSREELEAAWVGAPPLPAKGAKEED